MDGSHEVCRSAGPAKVLLPILTVAAVLAFAVQVFSDNKADVDLWGNVGFVKALPWSTGFHYTNTFSFTEPDHPWVNHEWLAEYIFHRVYTALGDGGLLALKLLLGLSVLALMYLPMRKEMPCGALRALWLALIVSTMGYGFSMRPHHFTYLMLAALLLLLKQHPRRPWLLPAAAPVMAALWANLHGAFFIGAVVLAIYGSARICEQLHHWWTGVPADRGRREDRIAKCGAAISTAASLRQPPLGNLTARHLHAWTILAALFLFVAATFVNPYGPRLWSFVFRSGALMRPYLSEWARFEPIRHFYSHVDFLVLAGIATLAILFARRKLDIAWCALWLTALVAALVMRRNIPLFAIVAGFAVSAYLENMAGAGLSRLMARFRPGVLNLFLALFIPFSVYSGLTFNKTKPFRIEIPAGQYPVDTIRFMQANGIEGNALVFFDWAELGIWKLYPACKTFLDGRFDSAYSARTIDDYLQFLYAGPRWRNAIDHYPTDIVILHRGNPAAEKMAGEPGWRLAYDAGPAQLYLREERLTGLPGKLPHTPEITTSPALPELFP